MRGRHSFGHGFDLQVLKMTGKQLLIHPWQGVGGMFANSLGFYTIYNQTP